MNAYPRDISVDELTPGSWRSWVHQDKKRSANFTCTNGHGMSLMNHKIGENGEVVPSVVCPVDECDFHEFISLMEWVE